MFLWTIDDEASAGRYTREFAIHGRSDQAQFDVKVHTPHWQTESDQPASEKFILSEAPEAGKQVALEICEDLDSATALPGPPMSVALVPDWVARRTAYDENRLPKQLLTR